MHGLKGTKLAVVFVAIGIAAGIGVSFIFVNNQSEDQIIQRIAEESGDNPWSDPEFLKSYKAKPRVGSIYKSQIALGTEEKFTAGASGGEKPYQFEWKFSDGVVLSTQNVTRTFESEGKYNAQLTAIDAKGLQSSITLSFEVVPASEISAAMPPEQAIIEP